MKYYYPATFSPEDGMYNVDFPDLDGCFTSGENETDALEMAADALAAWLTHLEDQKIVIPSPSPAGSVSAPSGGFVSMIPADTVAYRRLTSNKAVRRNVTLPSWLNEAAEAANINVSQTLQNALREQLNI